MFPNIEGFSNQHEDHLAWIGLQERVLSWLHGIHDPEPSPASARRGLKDRRRHHYAPYQKRCGPTHASSPLLSHETQPEATPESDFLPSAPDISPIWHVQENIDRIEYRTTSLIEFKVADDLPDPEYNPLITFFATDLEEEYCRLLLLCNKLEDDRLEVDFRWKRDMSHAAMRELLDIELSIQRVLRSAQYVIDYSYHCNIHVDFQTLFLQHYRLPFSCEQLSPAKPIHGMQHYSESAPQNQPYYNIEDVREQELLKFNYPSLSSLTPGMHNIWTFQ